MTLALRIIVKHLGGGALVLLAGVGLQGQQAGAAALTGALAPLGAGATAGFRAQGTVTVITAQGDRKATITISVLGSERSRVTVVFPTGPRYEAIVNQGRALVQGVQGWLNLPQPGGLNDGCDLLPQGLLLADLAGGQVNTTDGGPAPAAAQLAPGAHRYVLARVSPSPDAATAARYAAATTVTLRFGRHLGVTPARGLGHRERGRDRGFLFRIPGGRWIAVSQPH